MGILASLMSYFTQVPQGQLTEARIRTSSQRLIIRIRNLQYRLQQQVFKAEEELVGQMKQPPNIRSLEGERVRMDHIIKSSQKRLVYDEVIYSLNKIIAESHALETAPNSISNDCLLAVCSIIHVYEKLGLNEFVKLGEFLPEPLPAIDSSNITPLLQRYLNKETATHHERNLYALQLAARTHLPLAFINQPGHGFVEDPMEEQTPSSQMFAITLEEMQVEEA